jgi:hypothetical protein
MIKAPEFIQIPREALMHEALQPTDCILLGYIYWFTGLRSEACTASNPTLAELTGAKTNSITNALIRLENAGFIERVFKDKSRRVRKEIRCLVYFGRRVPSNKGTLQDVPSNKGTVPSNKGTSQQGYVPSNKGPNKNKGEKKEEGNLPVNDLEPAGATKTTKQSHVRGEGFERAQQAARAIRQRFISPSQLPVSLSRGHGTVIVGQPGMVMARAPIT